MNNWGSFFCLWGMLSLLLFIFLAPPEVRDNPGLVGGMSGVVVVLAFLTVFLA